MESSGPCLDVLLDKLWILHAVMVAIRNEEPRNEKSVRM